MTKTARTLDEAYALIRAAGLTPISMDWYVAQGVPVDGTSSVETWGPATYNHAKMSVRIVPEGPR